MTDNGEIYLIWDNKYNAENTFLIINTVVYTIGNYITRYAITDFLNENEYNEIKLVKKYDGGYETVIFENYFYEKLNYINVDFDRGVLFADGNYEKYRIWVNQVEIEPIFNGNYCNITEYLVDVDNLEIKIEAYENGVKKATGRLIVPFDYTYVKPPKARLVRCNSGVMVSMDSCFDGKVYIKVNNELIEMKNSLYYLDSYDTETSIILYAECDKGIRYGLTIS